MGILSVQKMKTVYLPDVYTSLEGLYLEEANVISMKRLGDFYVEWITETAIRRIEERSPSKTRAKEEMERMFSEVEEQVYFKIGEHSYFVDFFIPEYNIAVLIDEGSSCRRKGNRRDEAFSEIGIKTVRISEERVLDGFLKEDFYKELR